MEVFNLNIIPGGTTPVIHASQFDVGRKFKANLYEGVAVYDLAGAETLTLIVKKPDGNEVTAAVTNTGDTYVYLETTEQMTACAGANLCELRIEDGGDLIGSANFILDCEASPDTGIQSASEIHNLEAQVDAFTALAVADQYDSANVIFDNTPTAGHGNGYAVTSEGVETALSGKANTSDIPINSDFSLSGLSDTTITTPSSGQVLSYDGGKWKNNNLLVSKEGVGTLTAVNDTVQIPNDVLAKSIIIIVLRRYGYFGTITVAKSLLAQGAYTAGTQVYGDNNNSWKITISNSGVITLSAISGTAYPNVDCYGLF